MPSGNGFVGRDTGIRVIPQTRSCQMSSDNPQTDQLEDSQLLSDLLSSPGKLDRIADLVAQGEFPFPGDLDADELNRLAVAVRERQRRRLVKFIARSIALEIWRETDRDE